MIFKKLSTPLNIVTIFCSIAIISGLLWFMWPVQRVTYKKAIIIGASSGIGKSLASVLSQHGCEVGLTGRRINLLKDIQKSLSTKSYIQHIDVSNYAQAQQKLQELINQMGTVDLIIVNAGVAHTDITREWKLQKEIIDVNVTGFAAMTHTAFGYFLKRGKGHLVGISSIASLRGSSYAYTYCASKAFDALLLEGIRHTANAQDIPIDVTDIRPGFIDTAMIKNVPRKIWVATPDEAATQIYEAIITRQEVAYVTKRWTIAAWILRYAPDWFLSLIMD